MEGKVYSLPKKQGEEATFNCLGKDEQKEKCILFPVMREKNTLFAKTEVSGHRRCPVTPATPAAQTTSATPATQTTPAAPATSATPATPATPATTATFTQ